MDRHDADIREGDRNPIPGGKKPIGGRPGGKKPSAEPGKPPNSAEAEAAAGATAEAARADRMGDQQRGEDQMWDKAAIARAVGPKALDALKTPSNDGCAKFESAVNKQDVPFLREQCLDDHGLTYFTRNEMILADNIKNGNKRFDVLSREALVNHRLNQVDSCKQLLRTGRHMRSVYKANEGHILQARIDHMHENDKQSEGTENLRNEQENEIVDEDFKALLDAFKDGQLRPFVAPMSPIADKCMNDLLNDQGCKEKQKNAFIDNHGPGFKDDIEDYITMSQGTPLMDVLNALSVASDIVCNPPMSRDRKSVV